jgi:hypothetical protein
MDVQLLLREKSYEEYVHLNQTGITKCENGENYFLHYSCTTYFCNATVRTFISRKPENKVSTRRQKFEKKKYTGNLVRKDHYYNSRHKAMSWFIFCVVCRIYESRIKWGMVRKLGNFTPYDLS